MYVHWFGCFLIFFLFQVTLSGGVLFYLFNKTYFYTVCLRSVDDEISDNHNRTGSLEEVRIWRCSLTANDKNTAVSAVKSFRGHSVVGTTVCHYVFHMRRLFVVMCFTCTDRLSLCVSHVPTETSKIFSSKFFLILTFSQQRTYQLLQGSSLAIYKRNGSR